ncbi:MAG: ATP-binding protein [Opitutaceae bacterium]
MKTWWQRRTLRFRLALWYGAAGVILLTLFSATLYAYVSERIARPLDHQLRQNLAEVKRHLAVLPDGRVLWDGRDAPRSTGWRADDPWFELWNEQGNLIGRFWPFRASRVEHVPTAPARGRETISVFPITREVRLRTLALPLAVPGREDQWMIRVMTVHQPLSDALGALRWIIGISLPIVILLLVAGGYIIARRWLTPLGQMVVDADRITAEDLGRRLSVANPHDELGRLASVFNVTLDRLERSFTTLDRFVADASHELRTPLTTLRSVGEVGLRRSRTVEEYREIIGSMLEEAQRLQLLVQRLLELATAEGGAPHLQPTRLRLDQFVAACVNDFGILAEHRGQRLTLELVECEVVTDPVLLRQALQNLVENATKYSPEGGTIWVAVTSGNTACEIAVRDEGPGIAEASRVQLAERFFRPDHARDRGKGGFGLGLAITKAYMRVLGGSLEYEPARPHGCTFRLTLPKP